MRRRRAGVSPETAISGAGQGRPGRLVGVVPESLAAYAAVVAGHAGFQLTVTALVYPVLARTPASAWAATHDRHSRRITPLVVLAYGGMVLTGSWAAYDGRVTAPLAAALGASAGAMLLTAVLAAPLHGRLGRGGPDRDLLRRLLVVDRARAVLAVVALVAAAWAVLAT